MYMPEYYEEMDKEEDYREYVEFCHKYGYSVLPYYMEDWRKFYLTFEKKSV
jgi:hypothetical protein